MLKLFLIFCNFFIFSTFGQTFEGNFEILKNHIQDQINSPDFEENVKTAKNLLEQFHDHSAVLTFSSKSGEFI